MRLRLLDAHAILARGTLGGLLEQHDALRQLPREILLPRVDLALHLVAPACEGVDPRLDRPAPAAQFGDLELPGPAVAVDVGVDPAHRALAPALAVGRAGLDDGAQHVVAIGEDVGADGDRIADRA